MTKPICRDYNEKGYCVRGDLCPYDHGSDSIVVDEGNNFNNNRFGTNNGNQMMPMVPGAQPFFGIPPNVFGTEAYDPENNALLQNVMANFPMNLNNGMIPSIPDNVLNNMMMMQQQQQHQQQNQHQQGHAGGPMRKTRGSGIRGRGGYGHNNIDRMNRPQQKHHQQQQQQQQQQTAVVVDNIPPEMCDMTKINEYFKKFGTITNIKLQVQKAIVHFNTHAEAEAAYSSPDAIFDNRFVKVYWYKESDDQSTFESKPKAQNHWKPHPPSLPPSTLNTEPDPTEVAAKAAELAKIREEKLKKRQEQMKAVLDAQKQKEQLLQQKIDEQKNLLSKLSDKSLTAKEKEELLAELKKIASDIDVTKTNNVTPTTAYLPASNSTINATTNTNENSDTTNNITAVSSNPSETSSQLKEKLAKLEAEAASLGIPSDGSNHSSTYPSIRGGGSIYGYRGGWPRMARGGMKRSLDNRPTKLLIKDIPENINKDDLQQHFQQFGNLVSFTSNENDFIAHYSQRYEAEKAMAIGSKFPAGQLTLSWYTNTTPATHNTSDQQS
ncbi:unnamed protein product [Cunninghamella blakesleeana]